MLLGDCSLIVERNDAHNCYQRVPIIAIVIVFINQPIPNAGQEMNVDTEPEYWE